MNRLVLTVSKRVHSDAVGALGVLRASSPCELSSIKNSGRNDCMRESINRIDVRQNRVRKSEEAINDIANVLLHNDWQPLTWRPNHCKESNGPGFPNGDQSVRLGEDQRVVVDVYLRPLLRGKHGCLAK